MRRGGGGGVVIWHAEKRIEGEEEEEKNWKKKKKKKPIFMQCIPEVRTFLPSLISPSSCPRLPISISLEERPNRERESMQSMEIKEKRLHVVIPLTSSFLLLFLACENICRRVRCFSCSRPSQT